MSEAELAEPLNPSVTQNAVPDALAGAPPAKPPVDRASIRAAQVEMDRWFCPTSVPDGVHFVHKAQDQTQASFGMEFVSAMSEGVFESVDLTPGCWIVASVPAEAVPQADAVLRELSQYEGSVAVRLRRATEVPVGAGTTILTVLQALAAAGEAEVIRDLIAVNSAGVLSVVSPDVADVVLRVLAPRTPSAAAAAVVVEPSLPRPPPVPQARIVPAAAAASPVQAKLDDLPVWFVAVLPPGADRFESCDLVLALSNGAFLNAAVEHESTHILAERADEATPAALDAALTLLRDHDFVFTPAFIVPMPPGTETVGDVLTLLLSHSLSSAFDEVLKSTSDGYLVVASAAAAELIKTVHTAEL